MNTNSDQRSMLVYFFLCKLMQQTTLANTHITDDDVFENIGIVVRALIRHGTVDCLSEEARRSRQEQKERFSNRFEMVD